MSSVPRTLSLLAALVLTLAVAACGGSDDTSEDSATPSQPSASSGTSEVQDAARVKLSQCLREQGLDVPDANAEDAFARLSPADRQRLEAALQGPCREFQSQAFGDHADPQGQEILDTITGFTVCLRRRGVDVPDPDPSNPFAILHSIDQTDPKIADAAADCQDELAALNGGR